MKKMIAILLCFMLCISVAGCANGSSSNGGASGKASVTIGFENVENDPNNMLMGGKVAFSEDYIFYSDADDKTIYRVGYDGQGLTPIVAESGAYLNLYNGYLYYMTVYGYEIKRVNLTTLEEEMVVDLFSEVASVKTKTQGGKSYNYYGEIHNIFIVNDYLFYTMEKGWSGTSEGKNVKVHAYNLVSGEDKIINDSAVSSDIAYTHFTFDDENIYTIASNVKKLSFDDIKNKSEGELELETIYAIDFEDIESSMLSKNGFYYKNSDTNNYEYYDYKTDEVKVLVEDSTRVYEKKYLWDVVPVGESVMSYVRNADTLSLFKNSNMEEIPTEISNNISSGCRGVYKDKLYIVETEEGVKNITVVDSEGNINKISIN